MDVLVIGGTGPSGPLIVNGLVERGHHVTILHTGRHEVETLPPQSVVPHIHCDPFDEASFRDGLAERTFDVVFAMYGRLRMVCDVLVGRTPRLFSIGGVPVYPGFGDDEDRFPHGMRLPSREEDAGVRDGAEQDMRKIARIWQSEQMVFERHPDATHFRYPYIYGPNQVLPREWPMVKRALDGRRPLIVAEGGLSVMTQCFVENAAHAVMLAVDQIDTSAGKVYNVSDDELFSVAQVAQIVGDELGHTFDLVSLPNEVARPARAFLHHHTAQHRIVDATRIRTELGYADVVRPEDGLRRTIRWQVDNLARDPSAVERILEDPFDYAAEDQLVELHRRFVADCAAVGFRAEPGLTSGYYGPKPNPAGDRRSFRG